MNKKTVIIGASSNSERYSYKAAEKLLAHNHEIVLIGLKADIIFEHQIQTELLPIENVDTVTMYVGPKNQASYYSYIISLAPKRVVFNPGTENEEFKQMLIEQNIEVEEACTLVLLSTNLY